MPRLVDHDQRRAELAAAGIRIMLREGLDGVTVRGVAAEAGCSTGSLRHYFANQSALQEYTVASATALLRDRVGPRVQRRRPGRSRVEVIAEVVEELLPLDENRWEEYRLWRAIVEWERRHLPAGGSQTWADQRALYQQCIALLRGHPATLPDPTNPPVDSQEWLWAGLLHTFVDGLASQLVNTPGEITAKTDKSLLRSLLAAVPPDERQGPE